ncbi:helix-turn-helix domain-containing protein [Reinekea sp.]|jgi:AraC-like DNA-binding protein|uniref:helix-turn-helix domain-containing protein n=1 Tax=Reinekea sp. TaxID=1970455 RepID=UPI0039890D6D|tara:strand:+ start:13094 stop:14272 length:1179 start_codon:yes stop_codon:yes gene_type:complete
MESFEFSSVLFNFHDVILLMTAMQCLFCFLLLCITSDRNVKSTLFLALFLLAHALIPMNELMMWGAEFKVTVRNLFPTLYFVPAIAYYVDGALLFLCFKSLAFRDFSLTKIDLLHLLPLLTYASFIWMTFYSQPEAQRLDMINSESFVYSASYVYMEFFSKLVRVFYAVACFVLISRYSSLLQDTNSNMEKIHISWLRALVIGFSVVMISETVLAGAKIINIFSELSLQQFSHIGLTGYYFTFILVNLLVFTAVRYFGVFEQVNEVTTAKKAKSGQFLQPELAAKIDSAIRHDKIYMEPDITLDTLAESLTIMPRDLSTLINRHFGVNFYEFINRYRIEEAKRMLTAEDYKATTITDIYLEVGFNSKSVFYNFFKKIEGITPSQCRQASVAV